MLKNKRGN